MENARESVPIICPDGETTVLLEFTSRGWWPVGQRLTQDMPYRPLHKAIAALLGSDG